MMDIVEEEDPVMEEYDLVWHTSMSKDLCLFQFPLRPKDRPIQIKEGNESEQTVLLRNLKMKPQHYKIEADLQVNTFNTQYSEDYKHKYSIPVADPFYINMKGEKIDTKTNYAIGVLSQGQFHMTSLENIVQFRPSYDHVDKYHKPRMVKDPKDEENNTETAEKPSSIMPVNVTKKKRETEKMLADKKKQQQKQAEEEEPWVDMVYIDSTASNSPIHKSRGSREIKDKLTESMMNQLEANMSKADFLEHINPTPPPSFSSNNSVVPLSDIQKKPPNEQVLPIMQNVNIIKYDVLSQLIGNPHKIEVVAQLEKCCVLIKGAWVIKSENVTPPLSERAKAARDVLLCEFHDEEYVDRRKFTLRVDMETDPAKSMMDAIGVLDYGQGYRLKHQDLEFNRENPEVVRKHEMNWTRRKERDSATKQMDKIMAVALTKAVTEEDRKNMDKFLADNFAKYGVRDITMLKRDLDSAVRPVGPYPQSLKKVNLNEALYKIANKTGSVWYRKTWNDPTVDPPRNIVLELLKKNDLFITKKEVFEVCKSRGVSVTEETFDKIAKELCFKGGEKWIMKDGTNADK
ncbi:RNA polymerase III polypeptide E isoform 1 [Planoprotostelium fungivorum]|uniref:RNA polymerase III polypeptide E isoform 1 n=1 Tax=Planoprotostelium fungivorum TaxID=1890364 RepID=A0A2P6MVW5_9EUKA|nr:RNA polymerase III polypeptide E isoform 1 [Planoprotostelium fungivorum]